MEEILTNFVYTVTWWSSLISLGIILLGLGMRFTSFIPEPYILIKGWPVPEFLFFLGGFGLIISYLLRSTV